jgi:hypothetical protein
MLSPSPVPWPSGLVVKKGSNTRSSSSARDAAAGVGHREHDVLTGRHIDMPRA